MAEKIIPQEQLSQLEIVSTGGSLFLNGWNRDEIRIKAFSDQDQIDQKKTKLNLTFAHDAVIDLPPQLKLTVKAVGADAVIKGIHGGLDIKAVGGFLKLMDVGPCKIEAVGGDLVADRIHGDFRAENVGGDAQLSDLSGQLLIESLGGDADLESIAGGIGLTAGGDARLDFNPVPWQAYRINAGGDISASLAEDSAAELSIQSEQEDITLMIGDLDLKVKEKKLSRSIGEGGASISLIAGGKVFLSGQDFTWAKNLRINAGELEDLAVDFSAQTAEQIKHHLSHLEDDLRESLSGLSESLESVGISEENLDKIASQIEESSRAVAEKAELAAIKAQAKVEKRIARARKQTLKVKSRAKEFDLENFLSDRERKKSVTEDERKLILNMLQDKKISLEEADELLQALEGRK